MRWKEEQATKQGFRNIARGIKGNKKCHCHISRKSLNKENVGLLPSGVGGLVMADTQKAEVPSAVLVLVFTSNDSQASVISESVEGME